MILCDLCQVVVVVVVVFKKLRMFVVNTSRPQKLCLEITNIP